MDAKTRMTDAWIAQALASNPCQKLPSGLFRTCPVRLSFPYLFKEAPPVNQGDEPKFGSALLFPKGADLSALNQAVMEIAMSEFSDCFQNGTYVGGLTLPFRDQQDKAKFDGYVPGAVFLTATTKYKPAVVDINQQPIFDESKVYPGVWALVTLNAFTYRHKMKRGVSLGMTSVMIVQDDTKLGGVGGNPAEDFKGVNIATATDFDPQQQFGSTPMTSHQPDPDAAQAAAMRALMGAGDDLPF